MTEFLTGFPSIKFDETGINRKLPRYWFRELDSARGPGILRNGVWYYDATVVWEQGKCMRGSAILKFDKMKVIVAGMPKTGTKSMNAALSKLGYSVYDYPENTLLLAEEYRKIVEEGCITDDIRKMYENVDAIVDFPAYFFWDEMHKAFPDAKIILTIRDSEDEWVASLERQVTKDDGSWMLAFMEFLSPTWAQVSKQMKLLEPVTLGLRPQSTFRRKTIWNKQLSKRMYRQHIAYVMQNAPEDKLLVFKCTDGWGPLCEFLGVAVPDEPLPHKNRNAEMTDHLLDQYPPFQKVKREMITSTIILSSTAVVAGTFIYKYGISAIVQRLAICGNHTLQSLRFCV